MVRRPRFYSQSIAALIALVAQGAPAWVSAQALGPTYPIIEPDMLEQMRDHAMQMERSGELQRRLDEGHRRAEESIRKPNAVQGLAPAIRKRTFYFDPTLTVNQDIVTPDGVVLARVGDQVNPLDQVAWSGVWLFFDASDSAQLREASKFIAEARGLVKPVLVGGSYAEASKVLARRVYFDQRGLLVRRFRIQAVPATVRQEGSRLRVDEFPPRG